MRSTRIPTAAQPHQFEIRIAVLGYVLAGKTTVINALLRDQYGQVGMKRTTAGVNYFRLHHHHKGSTNCKGKLDASQDKQPEGEGKSPEGSSQTDEDWSVCSSEGGFVPAAETLRVISDDNRVLREGTSVSVKTFDVSITEPLCEVRPDSRLVLVDIPGINEAGADGKYRAYVREQWDTFDCVLVVMDGRHGANTEDVKLLEFVRDNNKKRKGVSVIIVCNKVDDPDDLEQAELVKEAKEEVDRVFRSQAEADRPIFVPTSAEFAYIYRTAALMSFEEFRGFDKDLIDRLGRKEVGWKFSKLSSDEKFRMAYEFGYGSVRRTHRSHELQRGPTGDRRSGGREWHANPADPKADRCCFARPVARERLRGEDPRCVSQASRAGTAHRRHSFSFLGDLPRERGLGVSQP
jgi:GTPase SAR1 family protein